MAAANMKAVKLRIRSVQNTMQITKAMQLVAASKLRRAREKALQSEPYYRILEDTLTNIASGNNDFISPYTRPGKNERWLYVIIAGDRGLAGGYNANLFRFMEGETAGKEYSVLPIGLKAVDYFEHRQIPIVTETFAEAAKLHVSDCFEIARLVCDLFRKGEFGHVTMCFTNFVSTLSQVPTGTAMLPLSDFVREGANPKDNKELILYEPDSETVFNEIVPEYLAGLLYSTVNVSVASELAARSNAMKAATDNAEDMIRSLSLNYNRARQASITQEITEIVSGAEGENG